MIFNLVYINKIMIDSRVFVEERKNLLKNYFGKKNRRNTRDLIYRINIEYVLK